MVIFRIHLRKCCVVVDSSYYDCAVQIFSPLGVQVVTSHRFLGGLLGLVLSLIYFIPAKVGIKSCRCVRECFTCTCIWLHG